MRTGVDPAYQRSCCLVVTSQENVESFAGQVMVLATTNLLSRWCRNVDIIVSDAPLHPRLRILGYTWLLERVLDEMHGANPFGSFSCVTNPRSAYDAAVKIGGGSCPCKVDCTIDSEGWDLFVASGDYSFNTPHRSLNPCGPVGAASVGVAQLFKRVTHQQQDLWISSLQFSFFNFSSTISIEAGAPHTDPAGTVDLARSLMVGVGMIGSSALYVLHMLPLTGYLELVDHDLVRIENLNRTPMLRYDMQGLPKAEVGMQYLQSSGLQVGAYAGTFDNYLNERGRSPNKTDLLFPLADEYDVRRTIENNYPPMMIYGTTTSDWGANFGRHIPFKEDCLLCRYPPQLIQPKMPCGEGTITIQNQKTTVSVALPFVPLFSATMMVAEILKLQLDQYPCNENFVFADLKGTLKVIDHRKRSPKPQCTCNRRHRNVFKELNGETRFAHLSD